LDGFARKSKMETTVIRKINLLGTPILMIGRAIFCTLFCCSLVFPAAARNLRVGIYDNPPKVFLDKGGQPSGIFPSLLAELARGQDWQIQYQKCAWENCLDMLERGEIDLMPDVATTPERRQRFDFPKVVAISSWSQLYRRPQTKVDSLVDLRGMRIAVLTSGVQLESLRTILEGFDIAVTYVEKATFAEAFSAVQSGDAEVAAVSHHFGDYRSADFGLAPTSVMFNPSKLYFATTKGRNGDVLQVIDGQLGRWQRDTSSPYYEILREWGSSTPKKAIPQWVVRVSIGLGVFAAFLGLTSLWLRSRVHRAVAQTEAKRMELEATLRAVPDLMFELDESGNYLQVHSNTPELLLGNRTRLIGRHISEVMPDDAAKVVMDAISAALESGHSQGQQICLPLPDGDHWFELSTARRELVAGHRPSVIMLSRDITQRVKDTNEIKHLADFDLLTELPNRHQLTRLFEHLELRARRHGTPIAVAFLDVDHFKVVNDSLGHAVGDQLLMEMGKRLRQGLRDMDVACRIGGDEFVLLLDEADATAATRLSQRIQHLLYEPMRFGAQNAGITVSVGVAMYPDDGTDLDTLMRNADAAMYQAKANGRNCVCFYTSSMQAQSERLLKVSAELSKALDSKQLQLFYQPVINLSNEEISGAEALLRWSHPEMGAVSPVEFIPIAESAGLIVRLGEWTLMQACVQAKRWDFERRGWTMAVNVSFIQFKRPEFIKVVSSVLLESDLSPHCLELELTESVAMGNAEEAIEKMQQLRELGVKVAIDDFGTGYSSMTYLHKLGFHRLKIDQGFVRQIGKTTGEESIIVAIVQLAHSLGMNTLAEGVETKEQKEFLLKTGCDYQQGWIFAKATPANEWGRWLER
jgi:diguanylate cyclase (GGDEF)-like protein/PAS domain S-box-containing protein